MKYVLPSMCAVSNRCRFAMVGLTAVVVLLLPLAGAGCGSSKPVVAQNDETQRNLLRISAAYSQATIAQKRPPNNAEELKPFLKDEQGHPLDVLRSPEDGEDY